MSLTTEIENSKNIVYSGSNNMFILRPAEMWVVSASSISISVYSIIGAFYLKVYACDLVNVVLQFIYNFR